jgi:hypothetical protein
MTAVLLDKPGGDLSCAALFAKPDAPVVEIANSPLLSCPAWNGVQNGSFSVGLFDAATTAPISKNLKKSAPTCYKDGIRVGHIAQTNDEQRKLAMLARRAGA